MKKNTFVYGLLTGTLFLALTSIASAQNTPILVGILDMPAVVQQHPIIADQVPLLQDSLRKEALAMQQVQQSAKADMDKLKDSFKIGSDEYEQNLAPIRDRVRQAEAAFQEKQSSMEADMAKLQYQVLQDVRAAIEVVAAQKGIIVVLPRVKVANDSVSDEIKFIQEMTSNVVIWHRNECEITKDVLAALSQKVGTPKTKGGALGNISGGLTPNAPAAAPANPAAPIAR
ncbi:MAG: OmpH family outer membrane protein [Planctomycetia bacterium]|nr:OmpH family outer membrane protein [Planctomycetia bacterium]